MKTAGHIRAAAVAGSFYPATATLLRDLVASLLQQAAHQGPAHAKGVIAPHAGYVYSGAVAAAAHASLAQPTRPARIVLIGPAHFAEFDGLAYPEADAFATPLGLVPVDLEFCRELARACSVHSFERAHRREHCLEVQLPFLQWLLAEFKIAPLLVGEASDDQVVEVVEQAWGGPETLFVISSDLSHYLTYAAARELDGQTAEAIATLAPDAIRPEQACGSRAVRGFLKAAARHRLRARTLELRNSGDAGGPIDGVVGYGAFAFGPAEDDVVDRSSSTF